MAKKSLTANKPAKVEYGNIANGYTSIAKHLGMDI